MEKNRNNEVVVNLLGSRKTAALFYDHVVDIAVSNEQDVPLRGTPQEIIPPYLLRNSRMDIVDDYGEILACFATILCNGTNNGTKIGEITPEIEQQVADYCIKAKKFLLSKGLDKVPFFMPGVEPPISGKTQDEIVLSIIDIPLIDTSRASWKQIIEFRKDSQSVQKLRKLRRFLHENYTEKDKAFIEDDLNTRMDDYTNAAQDWGFETKTSTMSMLLSSKTIAGSGSIALVSALFSAPTLGAAAAVFGTSVEIGRVSLHLAKRKYGFAALRRDHPLSYIIEAKERFESDMA